MNFVRNLLNNEDGATAIEYGLIAALVAVAAIASLNLLGTEITNTFTKVKGSLETANSASTN